MRARPREAPSPASPRAAAAKAESALPAASVGGARSAPVDPASSSMCSLSPRPESGRTSRLRLREAAGAARIRPWPPPRPVAHGGKTSRRRTLSPDDPPLDPHAVRRRLRRERAKRHALHEHQRERRLAGIRFLALIGILIFLTLFLSLSIWETIGSVFGL